MKKLPRPYHYFILHPCRCRCLNSQNVHFFCVQLKIVSLGIFDHKCYNNDNSPRRCRCPLQLAGACCRCRPRRPPPPPRCGDCPPPSTLRALPDLGPQPAHRPPLHPYHIRTEVKCTKTKSLQNHAKNISSSAQHAVSPAAALHGPPAEHLCPRPVRGAEPGEGGHLHTQHPLPPRHQHQADVRFL